MDLGLMIYVTAKGAFINDVTEFRPKIIPPPPSVTLKLVFYLHLHIECHKITCPLPPTCVMAFMLSL